jgi:hypothetical protein
MIHIIQLQPYEKLINEIEDQIIQINKETIKGEYTNILNNKKIIIQYKLDNLKKIYRELLPRRTKRGLLNGLGTLVKDLTGNLDNQDLLDIRNAIDEVNKNEDILNNQINKQIFINDQLITKMQDIQEFVNVTLTRLQFENGKINDRLSNVALLLIYDQHFYKINHIIDILHKNLDEILDIVTFSQQQLFSKHLLTQNETTYILNLFKQDGIRIQNDNLIYSLLELKGFYDNNKQLIFIINIPIFNKGNFEIYQTKTIPFYNKILNPIPPKFIILNTLYYQPHATNCKRIYDTHYCKEIRMEQVKGSCAPAIIKQQPAHCESKNVSLQEEIDYFSYGKLYIQPKSANIAYDSNCKQTTNKITEPTLIEFSNCTISIKNQEFSTVEEKFINQLGIELPYNDVFINHTAPEINLIMLHNKTIANMERMNLLHERIKLHTTSGHVALIFVLMIICLAIIACIKKNKQCFSTTSG